MTRKIIPARHLWHRLLDSFQRFFEKPSSRQEKPVYKRDFNRFPMDLAVMVDLPDENGGVFQDRAELRDISGSGAFFVSTMPHRYHVDQSVNLTIYLIGTDDVKARVRADASVVRIQPIEDNFFADATKGGNKGERSGIAVRFNETFAFERMDKSGDGDI
jgi:hypothetical protein